MERHVKYSHAYRERSRRNIHTPYTVIMHIYNEETHLHDVFDAIERQTVEPIDIIVVDDGSTDSTPEIIQEYGYTTTRLNQKPDTPKYIRRANAFNKALELAKQHTPNVKYVLKVDGDTQIYDSYAEQTTQYMEKNPRCAACSGVSVRIIKTRDLNNGAVTYRYKVLPYARPMYGWDRDIQLRLVANGYTYHVIRKLGYGEMRIPTVSMGPGLPRVIQNRAKSRLAEIRGYITNLVEKRSYE